MRPRLTLYPERADERVVELAEGTTTIGRADDNDVVVLNRTLSRYHAAVEVSDDEVVVRDLGSRNGTFVDGERIEERPLEDGETVRCGSVPFLFSAGGRRRRLSSRPRYVQKLQGDLSHLSMEEVLRTPSGAGARAEERLRILLKVSQLLSSPAAIDEQLMRILDLAFEILDIDRAAILMPEGEGEEMLPRVIKGRSGVDVSGRFYSRHIVRYVCRHSVATLFADAQDDPRLEGAESVLHKSICASMCAPLMPREEILGVLYVDNLSTPDRFTPEDLEFLSAFASQAAIAVENALLYSRLEREAVRRNNLLRFFPPATMEKILAESPVSLGARETEVTALFCDISGFTETASQMPPAKVVELLNGYFPAMSEVVFRHQGTLEKYIGDALLAVWGAPYRHPEDAHRALEAAVEMQRAMGELNRRWSGRHHLEIHIGLNTGIVAAGNIGSEQYIQYATIGDATNVASRICDAASAGEILLSASVAQRLGPVPWPLEELGPVQLKGRQEPITLYRLGWFEAGGAAPASPP